MRGEAIIIPRMFKRNLALALTLCLQAAAQQFDTAIVNGRVMDPETGLDAIRSIGIRAGRIAAISQDALTGRTIIDAKGLVVAPGFIDLHSHGQTDAARCYKTPDHRSRS